jgi:Lrp/AsnC family transcriptional regulator for asnA, asnC and gidA
LPFQVSKFVILATIFETKLDKPTKFVYNSLQALLSTEEVRGMRRLDKVDRDIIAHLQYDGRMPYTDIAAELGISEGSVRRRVKRMTGEHVLQIVGVVEPQYLDWETAAMVCVGVQAGQIDAAAREIAQFPEVSYLFMTSGGFDLFVEVYCRDRDHFATFLSEQLQKVPGVERTETFMILKMYKLSYRWGEAEPPARIP